MSVLPWFLPGLLLSFVVSLLARKSVGAALGVRPSVAWAIVIGFGMIVSATLTPLYGELRIRATGTGACDLSRIGFASPEELLSLGDATLNVFLFVPFGAAIGFLGESRHGAGLIMAALGLPFAIEVIQLLVPVLGRGCQSADVIDNLTGLAVGAGIGIVARLLRAASKAGSGQ